MTFQPKPTRKKEEAAYKTIYLKKALIDQLEEIAREYKTSFNNVVVSMIEECLEKNEEKDAE